jgi:hypothetical protein
MSEVETKVKRAPTEVTPVEMTDGRIVNFAGKRRLNKEVIVESGNAAVRFDFRNGETRTFPVSGSGLLIELACHGASQKIGDETAGLDDLDDMVVAVDDMITRLSAGEWTAPRAASGDSFAGASVVIRAICEATGKGVQEVKDFLQRKLDTAAAAGQKLSRRALYDSFRNPTSRTGQIIERLEREKKSKASAVDANELLGELA